jgi:transposase-like protein
MTDLTPPDPEVRDRSSGRRRFSAKYKTRILAEYEALDRSERGALLRREGLYSSLIVTWRRQRDEGRDKGAGTSAGAPERRSSRSRDRPAEEGQRPPRSRARQVETGDRDPGKTLRAVGSARLGQRDGERRTEMIDDAVTELTPSSGGHQRCLRSVSTGRPGTGVTGRSRRRRDRIGSRGPSPVRSPRSSEKR